MTVSVPHVQVSDNQSTRMHSSRMRAARSSSYPGRGSPPGIPPGPGTAPPGTRHPPGTRPPPRDQATPGDHSPPSLLGPDPPGPGTPSMNRITDTCKKHYLPATSFAGGKNQSNTWTILHAVKKCRLSRGQQVLHQR